MHDSTVAETLRFKKSLILPTPLGEGTVYYAVLKDLESYLMVPSPEPEAIKGPSGESSTARLVTNAV